MRKFIAVVAILLATFSAQSQEYKVIEVPGATKEDLYKRALYWISQNFKSANDVIQLKDKEDGQIVSKGSFAYYAPPFSVGTNYSGVFSFTFTFDCKDGKYRYAIDRISHEASMHNHSMGPINADSRGARRKKMYESVKSNIKDFEQRFEHGMTSTQNKEDW